MDTKLFLTVMLAIIAASAVKIFLSSFLTVILKMFFKKTYLKMVDEINSEDAEEKSFAERIAEKKSKLSNESLKTK